MVNEQFMLRMIFGMLPFCRPPVPGLFRRYMLHLMFAGLRNRENTRELPLRADLLQFKTSGTRLRAFYLPGPVYKKRRLPKSPP